MSEEERELKKELSGACGVGEMGAMVIDYRFSVNYARRMMAKMIREEVGEYEAEEFLRVTGGLNNSLELGFVHFVTQSDIDDGEFDEDVKWYVTEDPPSKYPVWWYRG